MNRIVARLLADYIRRTLGVWVLAATVQVMQASAFWANGIDRAPIIGAAIGALTFFATFDAPYTVIRTLPMRRRDVALVRWWVGIGWPALISAVGLAVAWWANIGYQWPAPSPLQIGSAMLASLATLGVLSVLPFPVLSAGRANFPRFVAAWGTFALGAVYGMPKVSSPVPVFLALGVFGAAIVVVSLVRAQLGEVVRLPAPSIMKWRAGWHPREKSRHSPRLRGWAVIVAQLAKTTALLTLVSIAVAPVIRRYFPALDMHPRLASVLPMLFVSATGVTGSLLARRWLNAIRALQILPIRDSYLALIMCTVLLTPSLVACVVATCVSRVVPGWGADIPLFMFPVFAIVPAFLVPWQNVEASSGVASTVQQWSPVAQIAIWPIWTGSFAGFALTELIPAWFGVLAVIITLVFAVTGYLMVWVRIRAGTGLDGTAGGLAAR
jgi:hypothetical protein